MVHLSKTKIVFSRVIKTNKMDVLFEYRGSRRELAVASPSNLTDIVSEELRNLGRTGAVVLTSEDTLPTTTGRRQNAPEVYLLQRWSTLWNCYVDVRHSDEVADGDRLAVLARPKPPSKVWLCLLLLV